MRNIIIFLRYFLITGVNIIMIRLNCDYSEGAHINILNKFIETNMDQTPGYGEDIYCKQAVALIKELCRQENADIHFLVGGT